MTSFTPEEMEFLKSRGNEVCYMSIRYNNALFYVVQFCRRVWLGLYDSKNHIEMDTKDENKRRDFMMQKYEKKRYYVAPTDTMHEEARIHNTPVPKDEPKQLKSLAGNVPRLVVGSQSQQEKPKVSIVFPHAFLTFSCYFSLQMQSRLLLVLLKLPLQRTKRWIY